MGNDVNVKQCFDYLITFIQNKWLDMYRFYTLKMKTRVLFLFKTLEKLHSWLPHSWRYCVLLVLSPMSNVFEFLNQKEKNASKKYT